MDTRKQQIHKAASEKYVHNLQKRGGFVAGAVWADAHPACPWKKAEDKWPNNEGRILIYEAKAPSEVYDAYSIGKGLYWDEYGNNCFDADQCRLVTYWMKMPDTPGMYQKEN